MHNQTQLLSGKSVLLTKIVDFVHESGSLQQQNAYLVWCSLSNTNKEIGNGAIATQDHVNFSRRGNLTDAAAQYLAQCPQLQTVNFQGCQRIVYDVLLL